MSSSITDFWHTLPPPARDGLLRGSVGTRQLLDLAAALFSEDRKAIQQHLAGDFMFAAWEHSPLNISLAFELLRLDQKLLKLGSAARRVLQAVAQEQTPADLGAYHQVKSSFDYEAMAAFIERTLSVGDNSLYWLGEAWELALSDSRQAWFQGLLAKCGEQQPVLRYLKGCSALAEHSGLESDLRVSRGAEAALPVFTELANAFCPLAELEAATDQFWLAPLEMQAHCLDLLGETAQSARIWQVLLKRRPWHSNLLLRVFDRVFAGQAAGDELAQQTDLLLYTYNKADDINTALTALAPSISWFRHVYILNNGSTDSTSQVFAAWQDRLGKDTLTTIGLPTNIGAPAARNWLINVSKSSYSLFLDDDAVVSDPQDTDQLRWLGQLQAAVARYPQAGVWGIKIRDRYNPWLAQSVDLNLKLANAPFALTAAESQPFVLTDMHNQVADFGYFSYVRPCLSVTGCCHLFSRDRAESQPFFNLMFSPSQYDDLERDLRDFLNDRYAVYTGLGSVYHLKRTGRATAMSSGQYGNGLANRYKLYARFSAEELAKMYARQQTLLLEDFQAKAVQMDAFFKDQAGFCPSI